jgi:ketosteroid isomerase-like protein
VTQSPDPVDLVHVLYDAFMRGDFAEIAPRLHPKVEYRNPGHAIEPGVRRGPAGFEEALRNLNDLFEFTEVGVDEVRQVGDSVVVAYRALGRAKESGVPVNQRFGHVWTFEDGSVRTFEWFATFDDALAAASR